MTPNLMCAIRGFEETYQFQLVAKTASDGDVVESAQARATLWFEGNLQPLHPKELLVKPEGQRQFKWWTLFTDLEIPVDSIIKDANGVVFRVMSSGDWRTSGYRKYEIVEGPGLT